MKKKKKEKQTALGFKKKLCAARQVENVFLQHIQRSSFLIQILSCLLYHCSRIILKVARQGRLRCDILK